MYIRNLTNTAWLISWIMSLMGIAALVMYILYGLFTHPVPTPPTFLMTYAAHGNLASVRKLVDEGVDVNEQVKLVRRLGMQLSFHGARIPDHGQTALMIAIKRGSVEVVQLLLENGARTSLKQGDGWQGVWEAIPFEGTQGIDQAVNTKMLQLLLKYADKRPSHEEINRLLRRSAYVGNRTATEILLPVVAQKATENQKILATLYCDAATNGSQERDTNQIAVLETIQAFSGTSKLAVQCNISQYSPKMLQYLLELGMNPNGQGEGVGWPLSYQLVGLENTGAMKLPKEKIETIALLLRYGADPRLSNGSSPSAIDRVRQIQSPELNKLFFAFQQP